MANLSIHPGEIRRKTNIRIGPLPPCHLSSRVWLAVGHTDMRRGMNDLALQLHQALERDPHAGELYVFHGRRGSLIKIVWHDGSGMSLYAKRLERGRFISYGLCQPLWSRVSDRLMGRRCFN